MLIKVRVTTGAKNESVQKKKDDQYNIAVREKAQHNAANMRVIELLAAQLGITVKRLRITKGHRSPAKTIAVL